MSEQSSSTSKRITFREWREDPWYEILINDDVWYRGANPPGWFFWVGMFQQYGRYQVEVVHDVID